MYEVLSIYLGNGALGESRKKALAELAAEQNCFWNDEPSIGRLIIKIADERRKIMAKDMVYCPECGEEYDRFQGHTCNPSILEQIAQDEADDQEARDDEV